MDETRILNTINGVEPALLSDVEPDRKHPECQRVNKALRGLFAEAAMGSASRHGRLPQALEVVSADTGRSALRLEVRDNHELEDTHLFGSVGQLQALEQLTISFSGCSKLTDLRVLGQTLGALENLSCLDIDFSLCVQLYEVDAFSQGLSSIPFLQKLKLKFNLCKNLCNLTGLGNSLGELHKLKELELSFWGCEQVDDIGPLGQGIGRLEALQQVSLIFRGCSQLSDVSSLTKGFKNLKNLSKLEMDFGRCDEIHFSSSESSRSFTELICMGDSLGIDRENWKVVI